MENYRRHLRESWLKKQQSIPQLNQAKQRAIQKCLAKQTSQKAS